MTGTPQCVDHHLLRCHSCLVQVYLPVHQSPRHQEVLDGVDPFRLYHQPLILQVEHLDDTCRTDVSLTHTGEEAVTTQVIKPVHVELTTHQLVQEPLGISVGEDIASRLQRSVPLPVHLLHHQQRELLVVHVGDQRMLPHVREGAVSDVMEQDGCQCAILFLFCDGV